MKKRGFTILELTIVFFIIGLVTLSAVLTWSGISGSSQVDDAQQQLVSILRQAREKTLARDSGSAWGVHLETTRATIFPALTYTSGLAANIVYTLPTALQISAFTLHGGGADVLFQFISGETGQDGQITIAKTSTASVSRTVHVYPSGYVEAQ